MTNACNNLFTARFKEFAVSNDLILHRKIVRSKLTENKLPLSISVTMHGPQFHFNIISFCVLIKECVTFYGYQ